MLLNPVERKQKPDAAIGTKEILPSVQSIELCMKHEIFLVYIYPYKIATTCLDFKCVESVVVFFFV